MYRNLFSGAAVGLVSRISSILIRFATLPLTLSVISKERYGLWLIILSLVGWLGMSDLGIPSALQNRLIYLRTLGYLDRSKNLVSFASKLLLTIGGSVFFIIGIISLWFPLAKWLSFDLNFETEFRFALLICLFSFALGLPTRLGGVLYNVHGKLSIQPLYEIAGNIVSFLLLLIAVALNWNSLIALACCNIAGLMAGGFLASLFALRKFNYKIITPAALPEDKRVLLSKGGFFFITIIGELLILQSDALLIGTMVGADQVPRYLIPATLFINFLQLQNIWLRPLWPLLTGLYASKDFAAIQNHFLRTIIGSLIMAFFFGFGIILFGDKFIRYWSHGAVGMSPIMAWGFSIYILMASVDNILATFLNSFNKIENRFIYTLFFGLIKVGIGWAILHKGITYIDWLPMGYAASMLVTSLPIAIWTLSKAIPKAKLRLI